MNSCNDCKHFKAYDDGYTVDFLCDKNVVNVFGYYDGKGKCPHKEVINK